MRCWRPIGILPGVYNDSNGLYGALGTPSEWERAIARDFFRVPPAAGFFHWLETKTKEDGTTVASLFKMAERE